MAPFLGFLCIATVDFARAFNAMTTITNCARNGAVYAANPASSPYGSLQAATVADADQLASSISVTRIPTTGSSTDSAGNSYVAVQVTYTFSTLINYPGITNSINLSQTFEMPVSP